jgi:hypothetical protein
LKLLKSCGIIDYSLLVGIHFRNRQKQQSFIKCVEFFKQDSGGLMSQAVHQNTLIQGNEIYFFGIIDTLIDYSFVKKLEHNMKTLVIGDEHQISVTDPEQYAKRFLAFISDHTD